MKKKLIMLLFAVVMASTTCACSSGKEKEKTEQGSADKSGIQSDYKIDDYVTLGEYSGLTVTLAGSYEVTKDQVEEYALYNAKQQAKPVYKDTAWRLTEERPRGII